jgi:ketosteroid isomerase-like protein
MDTGRVLPRDQEIALLVEGINRRNLDGISDALHSRFEFHAAIGAVEQRVYAGAHGMLEFVTNMDAIWDGYRIALREVQHAGEQAVAVMHISGTARASGVPLNQDMAQIITWRDGRMWRAVAYTVPADAVKAIGQEE